MVDSGPGDLPESVPGESGSPDDVVTTQSRNLLSKGDPLSFMLATFARSHEGDIRVAECLIHSLISRTVMNSKGLHVSISGESGKGKSHAIDTMRTLIPPKYRIEGRVSDKALFYMEDLQPGTVITLDDVSLSDQMQEILKGVTTSFQKPFPYRTVNKDRKPQICTIPERCVWWIAKVEGAGDDQVFNRMLTCWIDDTEEQDQKVLDRTLAHAEQMPNSLAEVSEDVLVCRQMWEDLCPVWVVIPFATRIRFQSAENRRNPDMLLDLIRTNAAICQQQREHRVENGITCVVATREDFDQAARLFVALNGETGGQGSKLTKRESCLISALMSFGRAEVTVAELQRYTGWTCSSICKLLHGYRSYGKLYSGLLEKCPAVSYLDRTVTKGDEGQTTMRRTRVFLWDPDLYTTWVKGGSVWLIDSPEEDGSDTSDPPDDPSGGTMIPKGNDPKQQEADTGDEGGDGLTEPVLPGIISTADDSPVVPGSSDHIRHTPESGGNQTRIGVSLASITPHDFFRVDGIPDRRRCCVCGKRRAQYQERITAKRIQNPPRSNLMLCSSCYSRAVSRAVVSIIPLPGVIDTKSMIRRRSSIGNCHLCALRPAVWSDPSSRTNLCDSCYQREIAKSIQIPGEFNRNSGSV